MKYRLIAVDMDGTLLTNDKKVTIATQRSLLEAVKQGIIVTLCSGRPVQGLGEYTHLITPDVPVVIYNGGMVLTCCTKKVLFTKNLEDNAATEIINRGLRQGAEVIAWANNRLYISKLDDRADWYGKLSGCKASLLEIPVRLNDIVKIIWMDTSDRINEYLKENTADYVNGTRAVISAPEFLEFMDGSVSKSGGLNIIAEHYGIKKEEIIAVGDSYNDLDMLQYAGLGVAMGNAPDNIKSAADYVTLTNEEGGVGAVIDRFLLT